MKTEFSRSNKDNFTTLALIGITLFALASGVFNSRAASANHSTDVSAEVIAQTMAPIVVTASRAPDTILDTIVVTASRKTDHA